MLNIEEILKISEDMGVEIVDGTSGKHYILDNSGKMVEFNTNMILKTPLNLKDIIGGGIKSNER